MVSHDLAFLKYLNINRILMLPFGKIMDYNENIVARYYQEEISQTHKHIFTPQ